jgi:molybdopterin synthase catalytic subunit
MSSWLTERPIDFARVLARVAAESCGGTAVFLGTVRRGPEDGEIEGIEYSAYGEMAEAEFERIVAEARARWPMARVALEHRLGYVPTGEPSIVIAASAPHRAEAFAACHYVIEETKARVPLFKRERLVSGGARWVGASHA